MNKLLVLCCISIQLQASQSPDKIPHKWNIDEPEKNIEYLLNHRNLAHSKSSQDLNDMLLRELALQKYLKDEQEKEKRKLALQEALKYDFEERQKGLMKQLINKKD